MTVLDDRQGNWLEELQHFDDSRSAVGPVAGIGRIAAVRPRPGRPGLARPASVAGSTRPAVTPLAYQGTGIPVSRVGHWPRRPVSNRATLAVAFMAAVTTLWLGWIAHLSGGAEAGPEAVPDRLAVVRVQAGETLQQVAGRIAPGSPVEQVVERIRDLNDLESAAIGVGQTLIAPVG